MIRKASIICTLICLILLSALASQSLTVRAGEHPQEILAGVPRSFPPQYALDEKTGKPVGFAIDVMDEVAREAGFAVRYVVFEEWDLANDALREGRIDIIPGMSVVEQREKHADFSHPVDTLRISIFVRKTTGDIKDIDDLRDRPVAVVAESMGALIMEEYGRAKPLIFHSLEEAMLSLLSGNTDALVYPDPAVLFIAHKTGLDERIKTVGKPLREVKRAIAVGKGKPDLLNRLDKAVQSFIITPKYGEIYAKWYVAPKPYWDARRVTIAAGILLLVIVLLSAAGHYLALRRVNRNLESALEREKTTLAALRLSQQLLKRTFASLRDAIFVIDADTERITECNPAASEMFGYDIQEMLGHTTGFLNVDEAALTEFRRHLSSAVEEKGFLFLPEFEMKRKDGSVFPTEYNVMPVEDEKGTRLGWVSVAHDITERKRAENERLRLAAAIEQSGEMVLITDAEGIIQYVNQAFECITGYTRAEVVGKSPRILKSGRHGAHYYKELWDTLIAGGTWKGRIINRKKDGSLFDEEAVIFPMRDLSGEVTHYVAVKRDVTEQLKTERLLSQAQKMESIGTMAGGIAHDFNNILGAISGYTELSLAKIPSDSRIKYYLEQIHAATQRAISLVRQILEFSRLTDKERTAVSLTPLIKETIKMLREIIPATIEIRLNAKTDADTILGDATQICQILMNLCTNAYQAMKDKGGVLEITLVRIEVEDGGDIDHKLQGLNPGSYLELTVKDTGEGIDPVIMARIFDPFFTTKKIGAGTGLGLSVVHGIVKSYGGKITAESRVSQGSSFYVYLPLLVEKPEASPREPIQPNIMDGKGRILLVDDEAMLANVTKEMLEDLGYTVIAKTGSVGALETFCDHPDRFDLVVTDQTMPEMTGIDFAKKVLSIKPDIPIILCTGFIDDNIEDQITAAGIRSILLKPVSMNRLIPLIRNVLVPAR